MCMHFVWRRSNYKHPSYIKFLTRLSRISLIFRNHGSWLLRQALTHFSCFLRHWLGICYDWQSSVLILILYYGCNMQFGIGLVLSEFPISYQRNSINLTILKIVCINRVAISLHRENCTIKREAYSQFEPFCP